VVKAWLNDFMQDSSASGLQKVRAELVSAGQSKMQPLIDGLAKTFGATFEILPFFDPRPIPLYWEKLKMWDITPVYAADLRKYAEESGDSRSLQQFTFIDVLQKTLKTGTLCAEYLAGATDWDNRVLTEPTAALVKRLRLDLKNFRLFINSGINFEVVFGQAAPASLDFHVDILDTKLDAKAIAEATEDQCKSVLKSFGDMWSADLASMASKLDGWIPVQWKPFKDELIGTPEIAKKMIENENTNHLSQLSGVANDMCKLIGGVHKDGCEGKLVEQATLKACTDAINAAIETVVTGYCLYKLALPNQIPAIANMHMRKQEIEKLTAALKSRGMTLGNDLKARMEELSQPGYQAPKRANSDGDA